MFQSDHCCISFLCLFAIRFTCLGLLWEAFWPRNLLNTHTHPPESIPSSSAIRSATPPSSTKLGLQTGKNVNIWPKFLGFSFSGISKMLAFGVCCYCCTKQAGRGCIYLCLLKLSWLLKLETITFAKENGMSSEFSYFCYSEL